VKLVQVRDPGLGVRVGLVQDDNVFDLTAIDPIKAATTLTLIEASKPTPLLSVVDDLVSRISDPPRWRYGDIDCAPGDHAYLLPPICAPEVWGAGVTYDRSREAREAESEGATDLYRQIYTAERPELFLKTSQMLRTAGPRAPISIRQDSNWSVPEPELAVVIGARRNIVGYTIGNDVSARDIEAANPLYLPQAKIFRGCCAFGPSILVAESDTDISAWDIRLVVSSDGISHFDASVSLTSLRRPLESLVAYLCRDNEILPGTILMTGTGIVPDDEFSLQDGYMVEISIGPIGTLVNPVRVPM
jgi:2-dehydro-3-deoxy-D-arabinonate dehydratase